MDFEDYKYDSLYRYARLPNENYVNWYALESLKVYTKGYNITSDFEEYSSLTKEQENEARNCLEYGKLIPESIVLESLKKPFYNYNRLPLEISNYSSIELPIMTLEILNNYHFEYYIKEKFEGFKDYFLDFFVKNNLDFRNQMIDTLENILQGVSPKKREPVKVLNLKELKFKDIILKKKIT